jgi:2-haloacid dehalogenase
MDTLRPSAIVFDVFGTVVDWRTSLIDELSEFGRRRGLDADWAGLVDAWRAAYKPSMDRVRRGEQPWTALDDLHRASLDRLLEERGLAGLAESDKRWMNLGWHRLKPWPDSVAGITRLKRQYIVGPLSNGNVGLLVDMAKHAGLPWDTVFGADLFQHYKPDPQTYLGVARLLRLAPPQLMLVAAHNDDLAAARAQGLKTGFVARVTEYGPLQKKDYKADQPWDVVARDMEHLAEQMGA